MEVCRKLPPPPLAIVGGGILRQRCLCVRGGGDGSGNDRKIIYINLIIGRSKIILIYDAPSHPVVWILFFLLKRREILNEYSRSFEKPVYYFHTNGVLDVRCEPWIRIELMRIQIRAGFINLGHQWNVWYKKYKIKKEGFWKYLIYSLNWI